jgi:hypothetical protein
MNGMKRASLAAAVALTTVLCAVESRADGNGYTEKRNADGQAVQFDDDPLGAVGTGPIGAQLNGFHPPRRCALMRPRVTFVPDLLKTVEKM